jgi:hypothetical protein
MSELAYDLMGDIHGCARTLEALLQKLDYKLSAGYYQHPQRKLIFLGDFIDRGPRQRDTLEIVRPMVQRGAALSVMGNHEFNALAYHYPDGKGGHLRPHNEKNQHQHQAFLTAYPDMAERDEVIEWFLTLPMFLEMEGFRVVHAAWLPDMVRQVRAWAPDGFLTRDLLHRASMDGSEEFLAVESLLKGWETDLPEGHSFGDPDGNRRTRMRTKWWQPIPRFLREAAIGVPGLPDDVPFPTPQETLYPESERTVFVGHYWLEGAPRLWADNVCCLDFSVAKKGKLVAYRWNGESKLDPGNFVDVDCLD